MSELIKADNEYKEWITGISTDFRKSQIRASMKINDEMLRFYWKLGKGISSMSEQFGYGMGFYKTVSDDLKSILGQFTRNYTQTTETGLLTTNKG
ncbi:MAG: DUF1016 N-terminal domain-containing protein [Pilosibacter sp.]